MQLKRVFNLVLGRVPSRGPDFFIVGASRSGTTYLHHLLGAHPDIFMPRVKELHYFNNDERYRPDLRNYRQEFHGYRGQKLIGEATPNYMQREEVYWDGSATIEKWRDAAPMKRIDRHFQPKIIITLRDPLSRVLSLHAKSFYQGRVKTTLAEELALEEQGRSRLNLIYQNRYDIHVGSVLDLFPRDSVHVMIFEEWIKDISKHADALAKFLGVEPLAKWPDPIQKGRNELRKYSHGKVTSDADISTLSRIRSDTAVARSFVEELVGCSMPWG